MPTLGITGGVATGKSTFRRMLLERIDADFFDADACARELLDSNENIREQVLETISPRAYSLAGEPNRPLIREIIYSDIAKKKTLEGILHPAIRARWTERARDSATRERIFIVDIPLLFETRAEGLFDHVIVVGASTVTQMHRMMQIRALPEDLSRKILASQWSLHVKMRGAGHVVWNDAGLDLLESQAALLAAYLRQKYD
ncbi:MAG: dephospho-CoA kinase [Terrimicrobiaceae bacterium]|nr:dephospho-CoA kinase [Terrimicrobiaceae bacterium]